MFPASAPLFDEDEDPGRLLEDDLWLRLASEVLLSPGKLMREKTLALDLERWSSPVAAPAAFTCSALCLDMDGGGGGGRGGSS